MTRCQYFEAHLREENRKALLVAAQDRRISRRNILCDYHAVKVSEEQG